MRTRVATYALYGLAGIAIAAFVSLGRWQLARGEWKARWIADYGRALAAEPSDLADALAGSAASPRRARARGAFDRHSTVLLDNQRIDGRLGVHVYTLFRPAVGDAVYVNRGFVPMAGDRSLPAIAAPPAGEVAIAGLVTLPPASGIAAGAEHPVLDDGAPPLVVRLDLAALSAELEGRIAHAVLWLDATSPGGFERAWQPLPNTLPPERHRAYAVQWFALALTVLVVTIVMAVRSRRPTQSR